MTRTSTTVLDAPTCPVAARGEPSRATLTALCLSVYLATVLLILSAELLAAKWPLFGHLQ